MRSIFFRETLIIGTNFIPEDLETNIHYIFKKYLFNSSFIIITLYTYTSSSL